MPLDNKKHAYDAKHILIDLLAIESSRAHDHFLNALLFVLFYWGKMEKFFDYIMKCDVPGSKTLQR